MWKLKIYKMGDGKYVAAKKFLFFKKYLATFVLGGKKNRFDDVGIYCADRFESKELAESAARIVIEQEKKELLSNKIVKY
jgi:hypothetical protein